MAATRRSFWRLMRALLPVLIFGIAMVILRDPLHVWLHGAHVYDEQVMRDWLRQARPYATLSDLSELAHDYLDLVERKRQEVRFWGASTAGLLGAPQGEGPLLAASALFPGDPPALTPRSGLYRSLENRIAGKREEILEHLRTLGNPTRMYPGQLPLFPVIYRLSLSFAPELKLPTVSWDSQLPRHQSQYVQLDDIAIYPGVTASIQYHLHAYSEVQLQQRQEALRRLWLGGLGIAFAVLALGWLILGQRRERQRERQQLQDQQRLSEAERLRLQEELRRQEAEHRHQDVERQNLELRSQIFANIGIMAGSYAHNIKNLLVRPNDLLRRCLDNALSAPEREYALQEVQQTLGTVTERLQQILQTVRRDPGKVERMPLDLNQLVRDLHATWEELACEKWKLRLEVDLWEESLWIEGDHSHLQQALENLLFNARDATFEMRNHLREEARRLPTGEETARRQALLAAAAWKGLVVLRTRREADRVVLEVQDNGIGMTEEVRRQCTQTYFSTKRDNALFAGLSAGMGLGLSFVTVILEHHGANLEIVSQPLAGATFRLSFPVQPAN